jgi:hypothetical protein
MSYILSYHCIQVFMHLLAASRQPHLLLYRPGRPFHTEQLPNLDPTISIKNSPNCQLHTSLIEMSKGLLIFPAYCPTGMVLFLIHVLHGRMLNHVDHQSIWTITWPGKRHFMQQLLSRITRQGFSIDALFYQVLHEIVAEFWICLLHI